jgi:hypothetical protein
MGVSGQRHAPTALYPGERTPGTHWTGGWVDPRAGLDAEAKRKILCLCRGSNPSRPVRSHTLYWLSYPGSISGIISNIKLESNNIDVKSVKWRHAIRPYIRNGIYERGSDLTWTLIFPDVCSLYTQLKPRSHFSVCCPCFAIHLSTFLVTCRFQ